MMSNQQIRGYTYLELAISMVILSIIYVGFMSAYVRLTALDYYKTSEKQIKTIQEAIDNYIKKTGTLPCPASLTSQENTSSYGKSTDCSTAAVSGVIDSNSGANAVRVGGVPFKNLNLLPSYTYDLWGNRIVYAAVKNLATTSSSFLTNTPNAAFIIYDQSGNSIIPSANTAYILVSLGRDSKGAYAKKGTITVGCGTALEKENCNYDYIFVTAPYNDGKKSKQFDDIVKWKTRSQLIVDNQLAMNP